MGKQKKSARAKAKAMETPLREQSRGPIPSDVLGSYTGTPASGERPEQDADDL